MTSRRRNRKLLATLFLTCLLCTAALLAGKFRTLSDKALQTTLPRTQRATLPLDDYEVTRAQVLNKAQALPGPRLKNPAVSSDGLTASTLRTLQEQRSYLETHGTIVRTAAHVAGKLTRNNFDEPSLITCHTPMIRSVNGKPDGVVFTPTVGNNIYRIEGCFFGDASGTVQLEAQTGAPESVSLPPIPLQLESNAPGAWSDRELTVRLDTELRGIQDYPVTLVIYSAKRRRIELRGCRFIAARSNPQLLSMIPSAWVKLYPSGVGSRSIRQLEYVSPTQASGVIPKDASAASAFVIRSDRQQFGIGADSYDFSQLNPGWVIESVQLQTYGVSCPEGITSVQSFGRWEAGWTLLGVRVAFEGRVCSSSVPPSFDFTMSLSQYAIRVWVVGPVGTQPLASAAFHGERSQYTRVSP